MWVRSKGIKLHHSEIWTVVNTHSFEQFILYFFASFLSLQNNACQKGRVHPDQKQPSDLDLHCFYKLFYQKSWCMMIIRCFNI